MAYRRFDQNNRVTAQCICKHKYIHLTAILTSGLHENKATNFCAVAFSSIISGKSSGIRTVRREQECSGDALFCQLAGVCDKALKAGGRNRGAEEIPLITIATLVLKKFTLPLCLDTFGD